MSAMGEEAEGLAGIRCRLTGPQQEAFDREIRSASVARLAEVVSRWARVALDTEAGITTATPPPPDGSCPKLRSVS